MSSRPAGVQLISWFTGYPDDFAPTMRFITQTKMPVTWFYHVNFNELSFYTTKRVSEFKLGVLQYKIEQFLRGSLKKKA